MPQLDPTWFPSQIFWLLITFTSLYLVLSRSILPALQDVLQKREQVMANDLEQAERLQKQAQHAQQAYEHTMFSARERVQQLMDEATLTNKIEADQALKELDQRIAVQLAQAEHAILAKKQQLQAGLAPTTAELTSLIVEKITQLAPEQAQAQRAINAVTK